MLTWWKPIGRLLRGDLNGEQNKLASQIDFPVWQVVGLTVVLACVFGASIGSFTAVSAKELDQGLQQLLASTVKAPLLFYLTLLVTFPSLYVFNALMGSQLNIGAAFRLLVASIAVIVAILASLGPIIVFFAFSTPSGTDGYRFIWLLVVLTASMSGVLGLHYLLRMLKRHAATGRSSPAASETTVPAESRNTDLGVVLTETAEDPNSTLMPARPWKTHSTSGASTTASTSATALFRVWVIVFAIVGAQMSWVLRPFIGSPDREFSWFRERSGNFFQAVGRVLSDVLTGS